MPEIAIAMPGPMRDRYLTPRHLARLADMAGVGDVIGDDTRVVLTAWGSDPLTPDVLARAPRLGLIAHGGGTVKRIIPPETIPVLNARDVRVTANAQTNARAVAEFALSWLIRWNKRLPVWERAYRGGITHDDLTAALAAQVADIGTAGRVVGIVGASRVGRHLLRLMTAFDMRAIVYDPFVDAATLATLGAEKADLGTLLTQAEIVVLAAPLLDSTRGMIGAAELARMRDGAMLMNVARGGLVNHAALLAELQSGRLNAVLDVTDPEPLPTGSPFFDLPNVWITPHVAGSLGREIHRLADATVAEVERFFTNAPLMFEVSTDSWEHLA